jgi:hypothetical protein
MVMGGMQNHELSSKRLLASVGTTLVDPMRRLDYFGLLTLPESALPTTSLPVSHSTDPLRQHLGVDQRQRDRTSHYQ